MRLRLLIDRHFLFPFCLFCFLVPSAKRKNADERRDIGTKRNERNQRRDEKIQKGQEEEEEEKETEDREDRNLSRGTKRNEETRTNYERLVADRWP